MKVVRLSAVCTGCLYPQEVFLVLISVKGWVDPKATVWLEGLCQWKIPVTPSRIEPATFWLVVQCLNQLRYHVSLYFCILDCNCVNSLVQHWKYFWCDLLVTNVDFVWWHGTLQLSVSTCHLRDAWLRNIKYASLIYNIDCLYVAIWSLVCRFIMNIPINCVQNTFCKWVIAHFIRLKLWFCVWLKFNKNKIIVVM